MLILDTPQHCAMDVQAARISHDGKAEYLQRIAFDGHHCRSSAVVHTIIALTLRDKEVIVADTRLGYNFPEHFTTRRI